MTAFLPEMFPIWVTFAIVAGAIISFAMERVSMEMTSIFTLASLILVFHFIPVLGPNGENLLEPGRLLEGFANPALITILALLVVGQGLFHSGALDRPVRHLLTIGRRKPRLTIGAIFIVVMIVSAFMNNTPVVVIFIPILSVLAERTHQSSSKVMIPLSFIAVLGGMTTLIGSSTNLLVAGAVKSVGAGEIGFFDFTIPGLVLASVGALYVLFVAPIILKPRDNMADELVGMSGKQFIAQIDIRSGSPLVGDSAIAGQFKKLQGITVRMIQRGERSILPPFDDTVILIGDIIILAATRISLTEALSAHPDLLASILQDASDDNGKSVEGSLSGHTTLAEAVVAPGSRMIGRNLQQISLRYQSGCIVMGIQRRNRMIRVQMDEIRLEAGDVLLLMGRHEQMMSLRANRDVLLLEWSAQEFPAIAHARKAQLIFLLTVGLASTGVIPIVASAVAGATLMIATGCLNIRQASRSIDQRILLLVACALAMGAALDETGGASLLAHSLIGALSGLDIPIILSAFFLLVAVMTNILSNNATAVLFTPIAISVARELGVDPMVFVYAVIFAANCSFATPMAYQTNLLVMGPGHYRFSDFVKTGVPLIVVIWVTFSVFAPWYYDLI